MKTYYQVTLLDFCYKYSYIIHQNMTLIDVDAVQIILSHLYYTSIMNTMGYLKHTKFNEILLSVVD